jgi:tRNA (cytidine/uridine-2'-O-)-methyltransferase
VPHVVPERSSRRVLTSEWVDGMRWDEFLDTSHWPQLRFFSKRAAQSYTQAQFQADDYLVFGPETRGLPEELLAANASLCYRIPMMGSGVRSLNLSNAVSIVLYEGLRQLGKT